MYTVQTGSFLSVDNAQKQLDAIVQKLNKQELAHLRIEKRGKYYPVRIGQFDSYAAAKTYLQSITARLPGSIVMPVHMENEKIVREYAGALLPGKQTVAEVPLPASVSGKSRVQAVEWSVEKTEGALSEEVNVHGDNEGPLLAAASEEVSLPAAERPDMAAENEMPADVQGHMVDEGPSPVPVSKEIKLAAETSEEKMELDIPAEGIPDDMYRPAPDEDTPGMSRRNFIGLKMSTLGAGLEAQRTFTDSIGARVGVNYLIINYSVVLDNIKYDIDLNLRSVAALIDWHPFKGTFRISSGVLYNDNYLDADARSASTYDIGDAKYTNLEVGSLTGKIDFNDITPYLGFGWDTSFGNNHRYGFIVDLGVVYQGTPKVEFSTNGTKENDPTFQRNMQKEEDELQSQLDGYEYYPVIGFGFNYRF